jgi:hypothetical protein
MTLMSAGAPKLRPHHRDGILRVGTGVGTVLVHNTSVQWIHVKLAP